MDTLVKILPQMEAVVKTNVGTEAPSSVGGRLRQSGAVGGLLLLYSLK